jgi:aryl-alcohol dehydrogenase-like predicted oxidoreductase
MELKYNEIGKTGMKVARLAFGASSLGGVFREINEKQAIEAVFTAIDNGLNFIDVSPYYGHYKAETVLGKALKQIPRDKYLLSTKVGRYGKDGVNTWDYSAKRATESVYESMERLNVDHIDLINVHDIEFQVKLPGGLQKIVDETLPALVELRNKGVVSHVGITDLQLENLKWVVDRTPAGTVESVLNFCHFCLNDDKLTATMPAILASTCLPAAKLWPAGLNKW